MTRLEIYGQGNCNDAKTFKGATDCQTEQGLRIVAASSTNARPFLTVTTCNPDRRRG